MLLARARRDDYGVRVPPRNRRPRGVPTVLAVVALVVVLAACGARHDDATAPPEDAPSTAAAGTEEEADGTAGERSEAREGTEDADDGTAVDDVAGAPAGTPLPEYDAASAVGDLAAGFPADLVPVAPGAQVLASSARPTDDDGLVVVTLNLRSDGTVDELTAYYEETLSGAGFEVSPSSVPSALTSLTTFVRAGDDAPAESVAVGIFDDETVRLVTISGQVAPG